MPDRLIGIATKIERAEKHIRDLKAEWRAFGRRAYGIRAYEEGQVRNYRVRVREAIPLQLSTIIGDAVSNLRSALDYLVYQLLDAKSLKAGRHHYFPISPGAKEFKSSYRGKIKGVGDEAERLIEALKPYKGGTDGFWHLNELCRIDKHRLLITVAIRPGALALNLADQYAELLRDMPPSPRHEGGRQELLGKLRDQFIAIRGRRETICPVLEDGEIIYREPVSTEQQQHTQFGFDVAFGQGEILECQPVIPALTRLADLVKSSIEPFRPLLA